MSEKDGFRERKLRSMAVLRRERLGKIATMIPAVGSGGLGSEGRGRASGALHKGVVSGSPADSGVPPGTI